MMKPLFASLLLVALPFCDQCGQGEAKEGETLHALLDGLEGAELSFSAREERLESIRALKLSEPETRATRDSCVKLHASLLEAEQATREASPRLEALERLPAEERTLEEEEAIRALLVRSHEALREAESQREECLNGMLRLKR